MALRAKVRRPAARWLAIASLALCAPVLAAKADYNRENVAHPSCDKRCLLLDLNQVLDAIGQNSPAGLPLAPQAKITSDGVQGKIESSPVWGPARRIPYRLVFADPTTESAVFYGVVTNSYERPGGRGPELAPDSCRRRRPVVVLRAAHQGGRQDDHRGRAARSGAESRLLRRRKHPLAAPARPDLGRHHPAVGAFHARGAVRGRGQVLGFGLKENRPEGSAVGAGVPASGVRDDHQRHGEFPMELRQRDEPALRVLDTWRIAAITSRMSSGAWCSVSPSS